MTKRPAQDDLPRGIILNFLVFAGVVVVGLLLLIIRHERAEEDERALATAAEFVTKINDFRDYYSDRILPRAVEAGLTATHDYLQRERSLPIPATMSIEFGEFAAARGRKNSFRIVSDKPFAWRAERSLTAFEREALDALPDSGESTFYRFDTTDTGRVLYYASAITMSQSCVDCHNAHADSPYRQWRPGDIRGIQSLTIPISSPVAVATSSHDTFRDIVLFVAATFGVALAALIWLIRRNREAFAASRRLAARTLEQNDALQLAKLHAEESLMRLRAVLKSATDCVVTIDETGAIDSANDAVEKVFGYQPRELLGRNVSCLMPGEIAGHHDDYLRRYLATGERRVIGIGREAVGRRKDGTRFPVELSVSEFRIDGRPMFTGIVRDITERKRAEENLRRSEEEARKLSLVASRTDNAVVITDPKCRIEWVNEGFTRLTGYGLNEVVGMQPGKLLQRGDSDPLARERIREAVHAGKAFREQLLNYDRHEQPYWIEIDASPVMDAEGGVCRYIAIERDVTEQRERERELEQARRNAEQAVLAKSRFLAMMSHEIRTPLNGVIGAMSLLEDSVLDDEQRRYVTTGRSSAEILLATINDILDFSKLEAGRFELDAYTFQVRSLVASVVEAFGLAAQGKGIELTGGVDDDVPASSVGDLSRIRQILVNLVGNALKFTDTGTITIAVSVARPDPVRPLLAFTVTDSGRGIPLEFQETIFEEFSSHDPGETTGVGSTGLGLAICKRLVEAMDGDIGFTSVPGQGSRFRFELPLETGSRKLVSATPVEAASTAAPRLHGRVLLAEDNPTNQMIARAMLERIGLRVDVVGNGIEAIAAVKNRRYDMVLMDVNMPQMDGVTALGRIRALEPPLCDTPIIAMTAHALVGDREKLIAEGMDDYISKPIDRAALYRCLGSWLPTSAIGEEPAASPALPPRGD